MAQKTAAIPEKLLAFSGERKAATNSIEQHEAEFFLQVPDLTRKGWLSDTQTQRSLRHTPSLGHSNEGSDASEIHLQYPCRSGIEYQNT
jgi:hypothetical protein